MQILRTLNHLIKSLSNRGSSIEKSINSNVSANAGTVQGISVLRRSLVTGASGCVGRAIVQELLNAEIEVNALVRDPKRLATALGDFSKNPRLQVIRGDLTDVESLKLSLRDVDSIFHAAAKVHAIPRSVEEENEFYRINVEGTRSLLMEARTQAIRSFVLFSTIAVYGNDHSEILTEETPVRPDTSYGKSKHLAELCVMDVLSETATRPIILRLPLVCGPGDRGNLMRMIRAIDRHRFLLVDGGKARKSIVFASDVASAAVRAASSPGLAGETFLIAHPTPFEVRRIAEAVANELQCRLPWISLPAVPLGGILGVLGKGFKWLGHDFPFKAEDVNTLASDRICDVRKMTEGLGYEPRFDLSMGIREAVSWYKNSGMNTL